MFEIVATHMLEYKPEYALFINVNKKSIYENEVNKIYVHGSWNSDTSDAIPLAICIISINQRLYIVVS